MSSTRYSNIGKESIDDLALFGGKELFNIPKSTSNLLKPDKDKFLQYSSVFINAKHYTNNGPNVRMLEERLAKLHQTAHCICFSSGFWGLVATLSLVALKDKTEVIMPSLTYRRMAEIASWVKLTPHFCDVDESTLAMSAETVKACINQNTAVILAAHPIVNCCDTKGLAKLTQETGIPLVYDSVESVYETSHGIKVGSFGRAEVFSMHACKLINACGGGYVTTNDATLARSLKSIRTFGYDGIDNIVTHGMNAKLNEMHACMALASLDDLEEQIIRNKNTYYSYKAKLQLIDGIKLVEFDEAEQSGYKNIVVELLNDWPLTRAETIQLLNAENILARAHYNPPLHHKETQFDCVINELPVTDKLTENFLNLPCGQKVDEDDITMITEYLTFISDNAQHIKNKQIANA
jgi:dTDP-4-amino-4,6-dideoxygalactose transaminase